LSLHDALPIFVGAGVEQRPNVVDRVHASAHRQRNEHDVRDSLDHVVEETPRLDARAYVEKGELVGALEVVAARDLDRIAGIAQVDEIHALDHAACGDVEAGNDALGESQLGQEPLAAFIAALKSSLPSYKARPAMAPMMPSFSNGMRLRMSWIEAIPPEAITGILSSRASLTVASTFTPVSMPSRPMSV